MIGELTSSNHTPSYTAIVIVPILSTSYNISCSCFTFRFDECGISPLTVKALTDAGYIQTTVVQEATLPICLEGIISYFTFLVNEFPESRGKKSQPFGGNIMGRVA